jgi:PmbA protein
MIGRGDALELAKRAVELLHTDEVEALVLAEDSALTRFANNRVHQSVTETDARLSVRAVMGTRIGVASTNRFDDAAVAQCCEAARDAAEHAQEDPRFPGLPGPEPVEERSRREPVLTALDPTGRAKAARAMIEQSSERRLTAAGKVEASEGVIAVANSQGIAVSTEVSAVRATVLSMGDSGSGWASYAGLSGDGFSAASLGVEAASLATRSAEPRALDPGDYTVVLAPEAVAEIVSTLGYVGFSAKAVFEESSFMSGHEGERLMSPSVTIVDDALSEHALGAAFDYEGAPKRRVELVSGGVTGRPVTDSYWAHVTGHENTGHALPAPNSHGPMPLDLEMGAGDTSVDEMISSVRRGVYVTRFHYVNVEDPVRALLTGMTRDGTFMIEDGELTHPIRNLRFTQGAVEALGSVKAVGGDRVHVDAMLGAAFVPALLVEGFTFTGQTG